MNPKQLRNIGISLGAIVALLITMRFISLYKAGEPNWYYLVMIFGMLLLLFYTFWKPKRRR